MTAQTIISEVGWEGAQYRRLRTPAQGGNAEKGIKTED